MDRPPRGPRRGRADAGLRLRLSVLHPRHRLQGHRGARGLFPENTLEGFRAALAMGLRAFELDIGITRDGVPVVHHDTALNPDIARLDGAWIEPPGTLLRDLTLAELRHHDVGRLRPGSRTALAHPDQVPHDGARIPTLAEVLALDDRPWLTVELKVTPPHPERTVAPEEIVERVLHVLDAAGAADRVMIESFDWRCPRHVARLRPAIPRGWLTEPGSVADPATWWGRDAAASIPVAIAGEGGGTWAPDHASLTREGLAEAHRLGLLVLPWTVNEAADMARLAAWGVDGLITDRPDRAPPGWLPGTADG